MMRIGRPKPPLEVSLQERCELGELTREASTKPSLALRAEIILACATGLTNSQVAENLAISSATVGKWRRRFVDHRVAGLRDAPRSGAPKRIAEKDVEKVVRLTLEPAPRAAKVWSTRTLAEATGLSQASISRIWRAFAVKPGSGQRTYAAEIPFPALVRDIVGLYLSPGEKALVLFASRPPSSAAAASRPSPARAGDQGPSVLRALVAATKAVETGEGPKILWGPLLRFLAEIDRRVPRRIVIHVLVAREQDRQAALAHQWAAARTRFRLHFAGGEEAWLKTAEGAMSACRERLGARDSRPSEFEVAIERRLSRGGRWPYLWASEVFLRK